MMLLLYYAAMLQALAAGDPNSAPALRVGDTYLITRTADSASHGDNDSSASSHDVDQLVERVLTVGDDGIELEWDLPPATTADDRARSWQYPARVFKPSQGLSQLRNRADLEQRLANWLKAGQLTRAACGHWVFTWNAFKIECDPQAVLQSIAAFDVFPADLRSGAPYPRDDAAGSVALKRQAGSTGAVFFAEWEVNPADVRRQQAEADVVVGEIMHKAVTFDAALQARAAEMISGTVSVTFDVTAPNRQQWTRVANMVIGHPDGKSERRTDTVIVERKRLSTRER